MHPAQDPRCIRCHKTLDACYGPTLCAECAHTDQNVFYVRTSTGWNRKPVYTIFTNDVSTYTYRQHAAVERVRARLRAAGWTEVQDPWDPDVIHTADE